jgi:hypothetical protein
MIALTVDTVALNPLDAPTALARVMTYSNSAGSVTFVAKRKTVLPSSRVSIFSARSA